MTRFKTIYNEETMFHIAVFKLIMHNNYLIKIP